MLALEHPAADAERHEAIACRQSADQMSALVQNELAEERQSRRHGQPRHREQMRSQALFSPFIQICNHGKPQRHARQKHHCAHRGAAPVPFSFHFIPRFPFCQHTITAHKEQDPRLTPGVLFRILYNCGEEGENDLFSG